MRADFRGLVRNWLAQPEDVTSEIYCWGDRLIRGSETIAVRYMAGNECIFIVLAGNPSIVETLREQSNARVFTLQPLQFAAIRAPFELEHRIRRMSRHVMNEGNAVAEGLEMFQCLGLPLPPRLARAKRAKALGPRAVALLAYYDLYVPQGFRYAVDATGHVLSMPSRLCGSFSCMDDFYIFDNDEDAIATKLKSSDLTIIDLLGDDDLVAPPPPPKSVADDIPF